jgi:flagellar assembly protein FliH
MRSTSSDRVVARDLPPETVTTPGAVSDLRTGAWTRLGSGGSLGDAVTESVLSGIALRSHQAARAQGYATGWAEGRRVALARAEAEAEEVRREADVERGRREAEHASALAALEVAAEQMRLRMAEAVEALASRTVEVALELTEAIVGREVATATDPGADGLRRALALLDPTVPTTVRLNPEDRMTLDPVTLDGRTVVVREDPTLQRGDAVAETEDTLVDATIAAALDRVREVLQR